MERVVNKKEDIITLRIDHSDWSMNRIAKEVGCSREYVRLVLKKNDNTIREKAQRDFILSEGV